MALWTVIANQDLLLQSQDKKGYLFGIINEKTNTVCALEVCKTPVRSVTGDLLVLLGTLNKRTPTAMNQLFWLKLMTSSDHLESILKVNNREAKCTCVQYRSEDFTDSYIFLNKYYCLNRERNAMDNPHKDDQEEIRRPSVIHSLFETMAGHSNGSINKYNQCFDSTFSLLNFCLKFSGLLLLCQMFMKASNLISQKCVWLHKWLSTISILSQFYKRAEFFLSIKHYHSSSPIEKLRFQNKLVGLLLDCMFGILFLCLVWHLDIHNLLLTYTVHWTNDIASQLGLLINWLMGAPAGLKLNFQLTQLMGQFFLYHVYIWTGYVQLLEPLLNWLSYLSLPISILGVTFQISVIQDVVSLLTLHLYCFYVYASRIYNIELVLVRALWRLFRGKKWNILRNRVDSASYDVDQLFIGTLLLTVFLFLLPTILLYYTVFLVFRLIILIFHAILSYCVELLNTLQIYTIMLWLIQSKAVAGEVIFTLNISKNLIELQTSQLPLQKLLQTCQPLTSSQEQSFSFSDLISKLIQGELLYPWVSPYSIKEKAD